MRSRVPLTSLVFVVLLAGIVAGPVAAKPLQFHGGPFLESFTVYPLYYGAWTAADIAAEQVYLEDLASYLSGNDAPASSQPTMKQYGVEQVTIAPAATSSPTAKPQVLTSTEVLAIVHANQKSGKFPAYAANRLLMLLPAHGFSVTDCDGCGGYHGSESASSFFTVIPADQELVVIAHELFEASADPGVNTFQGWDEAVDQCDSAPNITLPFGQIPPPIDNTNGGHCSTTGYTSLGEYQLYGASLSAYETRYSELFPTGWRLYSLQSWALSTGTVQYTAVWRPGGNTAEKHYYGISFSRFLTIYNAIYPQNWRLYTFQAYVLPDGAVEYNVSFRPGNTGEHQIYNATYTQFRNLYNKLYPEGWRLYILQSYVLPDGNVFYNAVFRPGDSGEMQVYGYTYEDYRNLYNALFPKGWRLYILDSYVVSDGTVRYNAVWRPATHPETQVYGDTYEDYRTLYDTLYAEGWRLYILNAYVLPGDQVRYDAVWRLGTFNRPL
jgi:hypothetical protein